MVCLKIAYELFRGGEGKNMNQQLGISAELKQKGQGPGEHPHRAPWPAESVPSPEATGWRRL